MKPDIKSWMLYFIVAALFVVCAAVTQNVVYYPIALCFFVIGLGDREE